MMCKTLRAVTTSAILSTVIASFGCGTQAKISVLEAQSSPAFSKVMMIVFENTDFQAAMSQPNFSRIAHQGGNLTGIFAETHPSQPNYIAMTGGDTYGVRDDANITIDARNIVDLLESKGKSWKVYAEDLPSVCFLGASSSGYARKHVPFISFKNIQTNAARCAHIVPATQLQSDIAAGQIPDYSYYVPNIRNDGHDTGVAYADTWLGQTFGPIMGSSTFANNVTLILTFDEGSRTGNNQIYTSFWGKGVRAGAVDASRYDHYSLLKTIETGMGLGDLGKKDASAPVISGIW